MAKGITDRILCLETPIFRPTNSAMIKANANRNPPRPWFQLRLNESGNTTRANRIGLAITPIAIMRFLFFTGFFVEYGSKKG